MIPCWAMVNVHPKGRRRLRLWLPLILLWIVLAPLAILLIPVLAIVALAFRLSPTGALGSLWRVLWSSSGLRVDVQSPNAAVFILMQ